MIGLIGTLLYGAMIEEETKERAKPKHGRWIDAGDSKLQCTSCHRYIRRIVPIGYDYCPYCGARMQSTMGQLKPKEAVNEEVKDEASH